MSPELEYTTFSEMFCVKQQVTSRMMLFSIIFLLQGTVSTSKSDPVAHFHIYGVMNGFDKNESTKLNSLIRCASLAVSSLKSYFVYSNRSCLPLSTLPSDIHGHARNSRVMVYKDGSIRDVCPEAPAVGNGTLVSVSGLHTGAEALYRCNEGYSLCGGSNTSTCLDSGSWTTGVNCTEVQTKWERLASLKAIFPCGFKYGSTLSATIALSYPILDKCYLDITDRKGNVLMRTFFKVNTRIIYFECMFDGKVSSEGHVRVKWTFKKNVLFKYALHYTRDSFQVYFNEHETYVFKHRKKGQPYAFDFYGKKRMWIEKVTVI